MTDLADNTAATSAGYRRIQEDRGAGKSPRYVSRYEKQMKGEPGQGGFLVRQEGYSDVSGGRRHNGARCSERLPQAPLRNRRERQSQVPA